MSSLLSAIQKQTIDSTLDRLHDTFAGDVYVYVEKKADVSSDANFNALYGSSNTKKVASFNKTLIKYTISARVKYFTDQTEDVLANNIPNSKGGVRLKIKPDDYEKIKICTKVEIGGSMYVVDGDAAIEGMFSNNYYTVYFKREN